MRLLPSFAAALLALVPACGAGPEAQRPRSDERAGSWGPGPVVPDAFRSDFDPEALPEPRRGGKVVVHLERMPAVLNAVIDNSTYARRILFEVHEGLLRRDLETWELEPAVARGFVVEDTLVLAGAEGDWLSRVVYGEVTDDGDAYVVRPASAANPLDEERRVPKADVERFEPGTAFTFGLRDDVRWHDGHRFDARDVLFSIECFLNPAVRSEYARYVFERFAWFDAPDARTVRVFFDEATFLAPAVFASDLVLLPAHVYDLRDPDHPEREPEATDEQVGAHVNEHPANRAWIGLGPYRVTRFDDQIVEAVRFEDYYDLEGVAWLDAIRWRHIADDGAARQALLQGELDFFARLRSSDYYGAFTADEAFTERLEKGYFYTPQLAFLAWNTRREKLADVRVRRALGHAFDWDEFIATVGNGLGHRVTASWYRFSPAYDPELEPLAFDLGRAEQLLAEAGWYDRDGDGVVDRDGQPLAIELLFDSGNAVARLVGQKYKENLERIGVRLELVNRDWTTFYERVYTRDFDGASLSWVLPAESDPEPLWHSREADRPRSRNHSGFRDERADALIERIGRELDPARRADLFHRLQRVIYEQQPYQFGYIVPTKFAVARRVRNLQCFYLDPGYSIRRWFVVDE